MKLFAGSIELIQLLATMCKQLYKFFAIVMEALELNVCEVVIAVKQFQPTQAFTRLFQGYIRLRLEVSLTYGAYCLGFIGTDASA